MKKKSQKEKNEALCFVSSGDGKITVKKGSPADDWLRNSKLNADNPDRDKSVRPMWKEERVKEELEKCKDPVYFYENYCSVNGKKPPPLREHQKEFLRAAASKSKKGQ